MKINKRKIAPFSPAGLALASYLFFIVSTLIPPPMYESIMGEPNFMFLDLGSHAVVAACVLAFCLGSSLTRRSPSLINQARKPMRAAFIAAPLVAFSALNALSIFLLLGNNPNLLVAWLLDGRAAKQELDTTGGLSNVLPVLYASCWWALWRLMELEHEMGVRELRLRILIIASFSLAIFTALIKVARYDLLPAVVGIFLVFVTYRFRSGQLRLGGNVFAAAAVCAASLALFVFIAWLRGGDEIAVLAQNLIGYTAASYNRLAGILGGHLEFPYGGTGVYAFKFASYIPFLDRWISIGEMLGMPPKEQAWLSEFVAVAESGLSGNYIWASAFGYVYSDIGPWVVAYFFALGMVSKKAWNSMLGGEVIGIVLYPYIAFSILLWMGDNFIAYSKVLVLIFAAAILKISEIFGRAVRPTP